MYFGTKSYLKSNHNYTAKHTYKTKSRSWVKKSKNKKNEFKKSVMGF
jgi:hypothetical protein